MNDNRVALFATGGYTEVNAIKTFLRKINGTVFYEQLCPYGKRKSKAAIKSRQVVTLAHEIDGLTGTSLISFVNERISTPTFRTEGYKAILIEDDKDKRFITIQQDGTSAIDVAKWEEHMESVRNKIWESIPNIPIIFLYAAPEIEAWFLADFDNSFKKWGRNYFKEGADTFAVVLKKRIQNDLLKSYNEQIEAFGFFDGEYKKLSDGISLVLDDAEGRIMSEFNSYGDVKISYSKRVDGENMLYEIDPEKVVQKCTVFFKKGYEDLKNLKTSTEESE